MARTIFVHYQNSVNRYLHTPQTLTNVTTCPTPKTSLRYATIDSIVARFSTLLE